MVGESGVLERLNVDSRVWTSKALSPLLMRLRKHYEQAIRKY